MTGRDASDVRRYRGTVASMWLDGRREGYLHLDSQRWQTSPSIRWWGSARRAREPRGVERRELLEWMVVWDAPRPGQEPYVDDVARDTDELMAELDANVFVLRGLRYTLRWIEEPERTRVLREVFGIEP